MYKETKYPPWSWSSSRRSTFKECLRKYYYNYYLAHNGWKDDAPDESQQAYRLKNLSGIHLLLGSAVHEAAEDCLKMLSEKGVFPDEDTLKNIVRNILNKGFIESRDKRTLWMNQPKKYCMLHEFYYDGELTEGTIKKIKDKMKKVVGNILKSFTMKEIKNECRDTIKSIEKMDTFEFHKTPVYAIPDLVYENPDGKWVVVDWKTGKEDDSHLNQINVYCLYFVEKCGIKADQLIGRIEYLLTGSHRDVLISKEGLDSARSDITGSIDEMKKMLQDADKNIPFTKEKYPLTDRRGLCRWCKFYEMDEEELI